MPQIRLLPEDVALKIAAGEVVTRPADAVKELVENAIDACLAAGDLPNGPHRVEVEIRGGGLGLIRVVDTGCGIPADELPLAFQRHATSKLTTAEDLFAVATLGFRGEALAAIAAVAQVVTYSRVADAELGRLLTVEHGRLIEDEPRAGPVGTSLTVRNLFQNVPARLRFLRTATGEAGQIAHVVGLYALAYPEIRFGLTNDGRQVFGSPGTGELADVLPRYFDAGIAAKMLPVDLNVGALRVRGFVGEPGVTRGTRSGIALFVNRRWVQSRSLTFAVEEAYQPALSSGRHPLAVLHVISPTADVDVNVHPTKAEVRFTDERAVYVAIRRAVRQVVLTAAPVPDVGALAPASPASPIAELAEEAFAGDLPARPPRGANGEGHGPAWYAAAAAHRQGTLPADWLSTDSLSTDSGNGFSGLSACRSDPFRREGDAGRADNPLNPLSESADSAPDPSPWKGEGSPPADAGGSAGPNPLNPLPESADGESADGAPPSPAGKGVGGLGPDSGLPVLRPIGQVQRTYIVAEGPDGVYFVDQHTAHERIRYEEVRAGRDAAQVVSQSLLQPLVVELSPRQWELLGEGVPRLRRLGFDCEPFGERTCLVRSVPAILRREDLAQTFVEIVDALATEEPSLPDGIDAPSALIACHSAVRAGDALTDAEMRALLRRLEGLDIWRYCPHGRPIMVRLDAARLAKDFGR